MMSLLKLLVVVVAALAVALLVAGRAGMLRGAAPTDLGLKNRQLKPPANNPNSVSSQASLHASHPFRAYAAIAPLVWCCMLDGTNKTDGFLFRARRKPEQ